MRILTFTNLFPNRANPNHGIFVYQRMAAVSKVTGIEVTVVSPVPYAPKWYSKAMRDIPASDRIGDIEVHYPRYPLLPKIGMFAHGYGMFRGSIGSVSKLHEKNRFDVIDAHYVYPDGYAATLVGRQLGIPVVVSARGTDINLFPEFQSIRPKIQTALKEAAGVIAVSNSLRARIVELGTDGSKVVTIGNGVDLERFFPEEKAGARKRLGVEGSRPMLVCVASLRRAKGHENLFKALQMLAPRVQPQLFLVGTGEDETTLRDSAKRLGLESQVHFLGARPNDELRSWYSAADASVLCSTREGWPNVVLESLACGTPVIATPVGAVPDILRGDELGMVSHGDPQPFSNAIEKALAKRWDSARLAQYGRSRSWAMVAQEVTNFFREVLPH